MEVMAVNLKIRNAVAADLKTLLACEQAVISAERPFDPSLKKEQISYYDLVALLQNPKAKLLVGTIDNAIVATGYGVEKPAKEYLDHASYAYLGFMYTNPAYRGQGINGAIIERLTSWAKEKGLTEIRLTVYNENHAALRAYEKVGFKRHMIEMRLRVEE